MLPYPVVSILSLASKGFSMRKQSVFRNHRSSRVPELHQRCTVKHHTIPPTSLLDHNAPTIAMTAGDLSLPGMPFVDDFFTPNEFLYEGVRAEALRWMTDLEGTSHKS